MKVQRSFIAAVVGLLLFESGLFGQYAPPLRREPPPPGQEIVASDGDRVVFNHDARVQIARRHHAQIRAIFNPAQRFLILLLDYSDSGLDGLVDAAFNFSEVDGSWPLGERWDGYGTLEQYFPVSEPRGPQFRVVTPQGVLVLWGFLPPGVLLATHDPTALANVSFRGGGGGGRPGLSFEQAEHYQLQQLARQAEMRANSGQYSGISSTKEGFVVGSIPGSVRVGGGWRKIHHVPPVYPEEARRANVRGVVILEVSVAADGTVSDARVLRGQPFLDAAALDAVRQWRYEPTLLNGQPVPVKLTATVNFP
jgi:TonB family protein